MIFAIYEEMLKETPNSALNYINYRKILTPTEKKVIYTYHS